MSLGRTENFQHYGVLRRDDGSLWELGRGAMGVTYKAIDNNLHSFVALKVIHGLFFSEERVRERFVREARAAASLRHRNVASIYHLGQDTDSFFYAMEYIDGETLAGIIERDGPLPWREALSVAQQVTRALMAAHARNVVHRDIKPSNIMLVHEPGEDARVVKLIDFGLAKTLAQEHGALLKLSGSGFLGTPLYASPEQCEELALDIRSDIYSLGITLWHTLAGEPPFNGTLARVFNAHLHADLPWDRLPADVPHPVRLLLWRMLAKAPGERFQTPADLRAGIDACLSEPDPGSSPAPPAAHTIETSPETTPAPPNRLPMRHLPPTPRAVRAASVVVSPPPEPARHRWSPVATTAALAMVAAVIWITLASPHERTATTPTPAPAAAATPPPAPKPALPAPAATPSATPDAAALFTQFMDDGRRQMAALRWTGAAEACTRALALRPLSLEALSERGVAYHNLGRTAEARADAGRAIQLMPADHHEMFYRAAAYEILGRALDARAEFQVAALDFQPKDADEYRMRGSAYLSLRRNDAALADFDEAMIAGGGGSPRVFVAHADANARLKTFDRAVRDCDEALRLAPGSLTVLTRRADLLFQAGKNDDARRGFDEALQLDAKSVETYVCRGFLFTTTNESARALQDFDEALRLDSLSANARLGRANVLYAQGQLEPALTECDQALLLEPDNFAALICRGATLVAQGKYEFALLDLDRAVRVVPDSPYAYYDRAAAYAGLKDYQRAAAEYREAIRADPSYADAYSGLGRACNDSHQYDNALEAYGRAARLAPRNAAPLVGSGIAYIGLKQYPQALQAVNEALRLDSRSVDAYRTRAAAERLLGRKTEASEDEVRASAFTQNRTQ